MKTLLAILNLIAAVPLVAGAIHLFRFIYIAEPIDESGTLGIIGGTEGPTSIYLSSKPGPSALLVVGLYMALLVWNGIAFWKERNTERKGAANSGSAGATPE